MSSFCHSITQIESTSVSLSARPDHLALVKYFGFLETTQRYFSVSKEKFVSRTKRTDFGIIVQLMSFIFLFVVSYSRLI